MKIKWRSLTESGRTGEILLTGISAIKSIIALKGKIRRLTSKKNFGVNSII